jgi:hypothetical protein
MIRIINQTAGKHLAVPVKTKEGRDVLAVALKMSFVVDARGAAVVDPEGPEPYIADVLSSSDGAQASIRKPSDLFEEKPGTDVLLVGHAHARSPGQRHVEVSMRVGPVAKTVRVFGTRVWAWGSAGGLTPGPALPIVEPIPILYELAWGGLDLSDPERPFGEARNTVGRGALRDARSLIDQPAAQIEDPAHPLGGRVNVPAGLGAIHRHWLPRASYAGTYGQTWMETKMPLLPDDFDSRFHVCVPPEQWSQTPLRGDEPIEVVGATPEGRWRLSCPRLHPGFTSFALGVRSEHRTHLDTVLLDADAMRVELTWHAAVPLPQKFEMLEWVQIVEKKVL